MTSFLLLKAVANFALLVLFLRFMVQLTDLSRAQMPAKAVYQLGAVADVARHLIPDVGKGRIALSALFLMFVVRIVVVAAYFQSSAQNISASNLLFIALMGGIMRFLTGLRWLLLGMAVTSFVSMITQKSGALFDLFAALGEPIIAPFRKLFPQHGMFDWSFLVALLAISMLQGMLHVIIGNVLMRTMRFF